MPVRSTRVFLIGARARISLEVRIEVIQVEIDQRIEPRPAVGLAAPWAYDLRFVAIIEQSTAPTTSIHI